MPFVFTNNTVENISVLTTNNVAIPSFTLVVQKAKDGTTSARIKMTLEENETITNAFKAKKFKHLYVFNDLNGSKKAAFVWVNATDTKPTQVYWKTEIGGTTTNSAFSSNNQPTNSNNYVGVLTNNCDYYATPNYGTQCWSDGGSANGTTCATVIVSYSTWSFCYQSLNNTDLSSFDYSGLFGSSGSSSTTTTVPDPCKDAKPKADIATELSKNSNYTIAKSNILAASSTIEHSVTFGKDANGNITTSSMSSGATSSVSVNSNWPGGFADLHNHTNNFPPSGGDLYNLIGINNIHSSYDTRMVVTPNGTVYALAVINLGLASTFTTNNPSVSNGFGPEFPSSIYDQFDKAHDYFLINGNSELNASEKAMSYVLEKNNTGVVLLKQDSNGDFKRLQTNESTLNGITTYTTNNCP